ncbi:MAG: hypothetical protein AB7F35_11265 [Acetobacteraceae bacterium]
MRVRRQPRADDHRAYQQLDDIQSGAPFDAFNRPNYLRHPMIRSTWERVFAVISLVFVVSFLVNLTIRSVWP